MASAGENSKFLNPGSCSIPECEVTLLLGQTRLYACKHNLIDKCGFFKGLFSADFKEKNSNEVKIQEVSRQDMLLFLECEFGHKALPLDGNSLSTLISLADQFICPSLQLRLNDHLGTESMFIKLSLIDKRGLIRTADKHNGCLAILETCIRLCANLSSMEVSVLDGQISDGAMLAVYSLSAVADKESGKLATPPIHFCRPADYRALEQQFLNPSLPFKRFPKISMVEVNGKKVEAWFCSDCNETKIKEKLTYEKVKQFEIDQNKLK